MAVLVFTIVTLMASSAFAESFDQFFSRAVEEDPVLSMHEKRRDADAIRGEGTFVFPPLTVAYAFLPLPIETRLGPQRQKLKVAQTIPWFGLKKATEGVPKSRTALHEPKTQRRFLEMQRDIKILAWKRWGLRREIEILRWHRQLLDGLANTSTSLLEIGKVSKSDVSQIVVEIANNVDALRVSQTSIDAINAKLEKFTDRPDFEMTPRFDGKSTGPDLKTSIAENHPAIQSIDAQQHVSNAKRALLAKQNKPKLMLGAEYFLIGTGEISNPDAGRDAFALSVGVALPIWGRPSQRKIEAVDAETVARTFQKEEIRRNLVSSIRVTEIEIQETTRRLIYLHQTSRPLAVALQDDVIADYESAAVPIANVLRASDALHHIDLAAARMSTLREIQIAMLEFVAGQPTSEVAP